MTAKTNIASLTLIAFASGATASVELFFFFMSISPKCRRKLSCSDAARRLIQPLAQRRDLLSNRGHVTFVTDSVEINLDIRQGPSRARARHHPRHFQPRLHRCGGGRCQSAPAVEKR